MRSVRLCEPQPPGRRLAALTPQATTRLVQPLKMIIHPINAILRDCVGRNSQINIRDKFNAIGVASSAAHTFGATGQAAGDDFFCKLRLRGTARTIKENYRPIKRSHRIARAAGRDPQLTEDKFQTNYLTYDRFKFRRPKPFPCGRCGNRAHGCECATYADRFAECGDRRSRRSPATIARTCREASRCGRKPFCSR